jgi:eukaryotic-like serine/threonine-protein kinase
MAEANEHENLRRVFELVLAAAPDERAALLERECRGDAGLSRRVEAMVTAAEDSRFLAEPTLGPGITPVAADPWASGVDAIAAPLREGPGTRIGPYKILQLIGEGGFGSVFMAEQEKPVQRKVALKIIKLGMDTRQVVARFEQERQALAMMDHPNIAKVFDAGATDTGRPFFVMELVKGDPIVEYSDKNNLSIEDRLELFDQVCNAVQHAHTKGIIHRDIKPSNILVSTQDGRPHTKVIDFGIAKATASKLTEKTLFTEHKALIGTPEYMSPEQAEGSLDIDTRTDVYSLGVLLYELLTGTTPFTGKELRSAAFGELQRIIREVEPPKPSTRLSANTDTIASVAARRHTEPKRLGTVVRGELDWIVMKALEKDRARRYETANGLAADIRRYLSGEAINAAPPSTAYRFKKFVKRNRVMVSAGSAVAAALLIGMVAFAWQFKVARNQRDIAVQAQQAEAEQRKVAEAARAEAVTQQARAQAQEVEARKQEAEARKQAAIAEAVATFQTDMLAAVDPANLPKDPTTGEPLKDKVTVVQALEAAIQKLDQGDGAFKDQPLVEAGVRNTIGKTLQGLGRYADAEPNLRKSLAIRRAALPAGHPGITTGLNNLAITLQSQNKLAEAEPLMREALAISRVAVPANLPGMTTALNNLAYLLYSQNKLAEAESLLGEALAIRRAALPAGDPNIAIGIDNLAEVLRAQNKLAEAEPLFREALAIRRAALPSGHPDLAISLDNLAKLLYAESKLDEAVPLMREALDIRRAVYSDGHPDIGKGLNNLANLLLAQNKPAEAEPLQREALAIYRAALPAGHPDIAPALITLATILRDQNKLAEAEPLFREALPIWRAAFPAGHPQIASSLSGLAALLRDQNKPAEAEPLYREALAINRAALPAGHPDIATGLSNLATVQQGLGKTAEARAGFDEAIAMLRKNSPDGSATLARALWRSGAARLENKDNAAALADLEEAVAMGEKFLKPDGKQLKEYRETLAKCKAAMGGRPNEGR